MPYDHEPPHITKKIERCVDALLNDRDFQKGKEPDERKSSAIAVCKSRIMKNEKVNKMNEPKKEIKLDEDGHIIVAENVKVIFGGKIVMEDIKND